MQGTHVIKVGTCPGYRLGLKTMILRRSKNHKMSKKSTKEVTAKWLLKFQRRLSSCF